MVELGDKHQFAHTAQSPVPIYIIVYALNLPVGEEAQLLQLRTVGTVDVDGVGMPVHVVVVEILGGHQCLFALAFSLHEKLLHEVVPREELRRGGQCTE